VAVATSMLNSQAFDLVVADLNLPDGSGLTVVEKAIGGGLKVLFLTGDGLALEPGSLAPYHYLLKPIRAAELIAAIERRLAE
jgi:DNA-binding response OmpR family regulator